MLDLVEFLKPINICSISSDLTCSSKNSYPWMLYLMSATELGKTKVLDLSSSEVWFVRVRLIRTGASVLLATVSVQGLGSLSETREHLKTLSGKIVKLGTFKTDIKAQLCERKKFKL